MKNKRVLKKYLAAILSGLVLITIPSGCAFASAASQTGNPVTGRNAESSPMLTYTKDDPAARESNFYNPEYGECSKILCDEDTENDSKRLQDMIRVCEKCEHRGFGREHKSGSDYESR